MRITRLLCCFTSKSGFIHHRLTKLKTERNFHHFIKLKCNPSRTILATNKVDGLLKHTDSDENEDHEDFTEMHLEQVQQVEPLQSARDVLFKNSKDRIIDDLNKCVSVGEVLYLVEKHIDIFEDAHVVQTIFVLKDLQNICHHYSSTITANTFIENLCKRPEFECVLKYIGNKLGSFNPEYLNYAFFYLHKLGIPVEHQLMQNIALQLRDYLLSDFSLDICSRFLKVIFSENSIRSYYMSLNLIPKITSFVGQCKSATDLGNLTICLCSLHNIVTNDTLKEYIKQVRDFISCKKITGDDYRIILQIIFFLNYPKWRNQNATLTSECVLFMQKEIGLLNIPEIISLYDVLYKNQEPGEVLNSVQQYSAKHLHRFDTEPLEFYARLKLFSSLIYFSSPIHKIQFRKDVQKYVKPFDTFGIFILLRKIFSYVKVTDEKLCSKYWNLSLNLLNGSANNHNISRMCINYLSFNTDVEDFRHFKFEHKIMKTIEEGMKNNALLFPGTISSYLSFAMVYGKSKLILKYLLDKFEQNLLQFGAVDCMRISQSILLLTGTKDSCIEKSQIDKIKKLLNRRTEDIVATDENNFQQNNLLIGASILRNDYDNYTIENLLMKYKEIDYMSSKTIENICHAFTATDSLIPEVINKCTEYVIKYPVNILGFNAERILNLCYYMAYYPINANKFFEIITNIIIRDQERLSGLSFLQSSICLSYFNRLPSSFIKQIFNVEFLEKLDEELAHCYSKDKYPQRVRNNLMQLNRAVCLEYPEFNIPWFHKKYIEEQRKSCRVDTDIENHFMLRIKEYLTQIVGRSDYILENVITPYGYHIDIVINLDDKGKPVLSESINIKRRVAILLVRPHSYTRFYIRLKGRHQLKKRHLEILGYSVAIIKFSEWMNLLYAEERLEYLSNVIWPSDFRTSSVCER